MYRRGRISGDGSRFVCAPAGGWRAARRAGAWILEGRYAEAPTVQSSGSWRHCRRTQRRTQRSSSQRDQRECNCRPGCSVDVPEQGELIFGYPPKCQPRPECVYGRMHDHGEEDATPRSIEQPREYDCGGADAHDKGWYDLPRELRAHERRMPDCPHNRDAERCCEHVHAALEHRLQETTPCGLFT